MVRRNKRGQAAMEFLMTYGWAILVVLAAIGALAYFGVLSPDNFLPNKCTISPQFHCNEWKVNTDGTIQLQIQNNVGETVNGTVYLLNVDRGDCPYADASTDGTGNVTIFGNTRNGEDLEGGPTAGLITLDCALSSGQLTEGDKFQADLVVEYQSSGSALVHKASGSLQTKVE